MTGVVDAIVETGLDTVFHCDAAHVGNIRFGNIRIEESPRLISLWIGTFVWT